MKHYNIPVFISHFGCPNSCVFCNQKKINGRETDVSLEDLKNIIDSYLETLPKNSIKQVAFFGGTFTGISMSLQKDYLEVVKKYIDAGEIQGIRLSTRPDCISDEILKQLKKYGVQTIELGIQSLDSKVLSATDRKYDEGVVENSCKLIKKYEFELGIQLMIGLPCSDLKSDYETAKKCLELKPDIARIYPTLVISGTELQKMYLRREYNALDINEAIFRTKKIYALLETNGINIIRVGLQPSEDLTAEGVILAGPFHPAFRDLVENEIYRDFLFEIIKKEKKLDIEVNEKNISRIVGQKKKNKKEFSPYFNLKINNDLDKYKIKVNGKLYERSDILKRELKE
ncbi:elongator complex protein 3 [Fusobacterium gastrosuis]|uniref:elongator complex protein 3 n=1 Tax=Fusobacterium gastrosuis TaxID=1755100 RepID=UPI002A9EA080|nr:radical SAM protein [Fusobacterium gastrosuis]